MQYMRECILGNFRRRLHAVLKSDTDLQRPTVLESLIRRHVSIIHLAEQHISMDLTQGMREVLLTEAFCGPVSSLHTFEKPAEQHRICHQGRLQLICRKHREGRLGSRDPFCTTPQML